MRTNADGSLSAVTLASLNITQINLTQDATQIALPDGSQITGQATFVMGGQTRTLANVTLMAEAQGNRVTSVTTGTTTVHTGYDTAGEKAFIVTSVSNATGTNVTNRFDDNADGVTDRLQTIITTTTNGVKTETLTSYVGATTAGVQTDQTQTVTYANGNVTIWRDTTGGGWFDQKEVMTTDAGVRSHTVYALSRGDGDVISQTNGLISDVREYALSERDATAIDDLAALGSRFDPNGDCKVTGTRLTGFKVTVTKVNDSQTSQKPTTFGITELCLTADTLVETFSERKDVSGQNMSAQAGIRVRSNSPPDRRFAAIGGPDLRTSVFLESCSA
jgi:acyl-coenzyme A thioesterase PaaI-like protein